MRKPSLARWLAAFLACLLMLPLLAACAGSNAQPTSTLAPRPSDIPEVPSTAVSQATVEPTKALTTEPTVGSTTEPTLATTIGSADPSALQIGTLKSYTYKTGLFAIQVPETWQVSESDGDTISVSWVAPEGNSGVFVGLRQATDTLTDTQLGEFGKTYVQTVFGTEPKFESQDPVTQTDGSVLVGFKMTSKINDADVALIGLTYVEQRGNKVSALTVLFLELDAENLWTNHFEKIVNSYKIDPSVSIP